MINVDSRRRSHSATAPADPPRTAEADTAPGQRRIRTPAPAPPAAPPDPRPAAPPAPRALHPAPPTAY
ncbi:hypothetical protein D7319_02360 [Streptomyces radicis]|uniref:Uncharacterized protein n=1 Tax=Streptomyces radicis TaxID=1750517 RepID=A0A3A9WIJ3_9ACTN|nr:hypothetical protein D7319_02360 [Streptomyces radicis]RKN27440.1 hypothetical protein D7318_00535 [Streptomyces radicis]